MASPEVPDNAPERKFVLQKRGRRLFTVVTIYWYLPGICPSAAQTARGPAVNKPGNQLHVLGAQTRQHAHLRRRVQIQVRDVLYRKCMHAHGSGPIPYFAIPVEAIGMP